VRITMIVGSLLSLLGAAAVGQTPAPAPIYRTSWADVAAVAGTGVIALLPGVLKLPKGTSPCAPCSQSGLPGIDRWVIGKDSPSARTGSTVLLLGVGGVATYLAMHDRSTAQARGNLAVIANSAGWGVATADWLKVAFHRKRPILYSSGAAAAAADPDSRRSFPSGHTTVAFAVATSYLVMANHEHLPHRTRNALLLYGGAAGVGALRIVAGSHFPTDVLGGAVLGAGIGWLVAAVHPKLP
jgi:membrane-associated phospholipid phosphatase